MLRLLLRTALVVGEAGDGEAEDDESRCSMGSGDGVLLRLVSLLAACGGGCSAASFARRARQACTRCSRSLAAAGDMLLGLVAVPTASSSARASARAAWSENMSVPNTRAEVFCSDGRQGLAP